MINVSQPVVPNPYLPTFRIFSYNTSEGSTDTDDGQSNEDRKKKKKKKGTKRKHGHRRGDHGNKDHHCKEEPYRDSWKCHLNDTWYSDPDSPSRSNQQWTGLGYAQVWLNDFRVVLIGF